MSCFSKRRYLVPLLCTLLSLSARAQQNSSFEAITTDDGLSQGMVYDILQDREGFLWLATKDGLNRYDGYEFKVFTNDPNDPWSISENSIIKLFEDTQGRIWAATNNEGLNIYDKKTGRFHHLRHDPDDPTSLAGDYIDAIVEDTSGYFIVKIGDKELNMFSLEDEFFNAQKAPTIIRVPMPPQEKRRLISGDDLKISHKDLRGLVADRKHRIWVGGNDAIYQLDVKKAALTLAVDGYSFICAFPDENGSIWGSSYQHVLFNWDGIRATPFLCNISLPRDLIVDDQSTLWALSVDTLNGFDLTDWRPDIPTDSKMNRQRYKRVIESAGQFSPYPNKSMTIDRSGTLWVGSSGFGLYKTNPHEGLFSHQLPGVSIKNIVADAEGVKYLQDYSDQWLNPDSTCIAHSELPPPRWGCFVGNILTSTSGDFWFSYVFHDKNGGHEQQLNPSEASNVIKKYNPQTKEARIYTINWAHQHGQPIIEARDGSIWLAGYDDVLSHLDPITGEVLSYDLKTGKPVLSSRKEEYRSEDFSTALLEDAEGVIWVGTERGITKCLRPKTKEGKLQVTSFRNIAGDRSSLSYNHVTCFLEDPFSPQQYLWVCTKGGGLNRLNKETGKFTHLTQKDGLPNDVVYGLLPDAAGNLWGSTNKGLFCMSQNKPGDGSADKKFTFRNFSKADGLQENEFNTGAFRKLPDGRLAFGGVNGYNVFDPKEVLSDDFIPPVYITNILVNNQAVAPHDESGVLNTTIENTKEITLNPRQNILTLEFAALDFNAPDQNQYRYQLIGADDNWVEAGNRRSATFLNLQPKEYTFRVQGSNSQGIWSDQMAELHVIVLPPWWKTWWAYLIYITILIAAIWAYLQFSVNRAKLQQQLAYEKRETDRVKDLDALKTQLYTNMTHEFRTPLTIILGMAKQVQEDPKTYSESGMDMIIRNGQSLLDLVNKMLDLSKLESGKMTLELVQGDVVFFLRNLVESFRSYAANKEIQLHFLPEVNSVMMDFDADKLQQVISNLISNAFKFTPEGGHIYFYLSKENSALKIRVKDTGRGIPTADLGNIFDRFYQVDNSTTRKYEGSGIGLALSKELITLMKGSISVLSPPIGLKKGAEFTIVLPIENTAEIELPVLANTVDNRVKIVGIKHEGLAITPEKKKEKLATVAEIVTEQAIETPLILLAEDNQDVAAYVASCLPKDYRLVIAQNGQEGLQLAIEIIPDLIISDVMMPIMSGFELCEKLKSDQRTGHIPVIMLTARADTNSKIEGLEIGANAYLPKPFEKQELLLTIKNLFNLRNKLRRHYQRISGLVEGSEATKEVAKQTKPEDAFVIKTRQFIEERISNFDLSVEQLAKELHLSHSQFGRKLDALTGLSPNRFIRSIRLKKAKELLKNQDLSITVVAYDCGFSDPSYFTRVFKKELGRTPMDWRREVGTENV